MATGGLAVGSLAPTAGANGQRTVQAAQAKARVSKAKRAKIGAAKKMYYTALTGAPFDYFRLADVNGDKVPELFTYSPSTGYTSSSAYIYTYNGKLGLASQAGIPPTKFYKKAHVLYYYYMHSGYHKGAYCKIVKGKLVNLAEWHSVEAKKLASGRIIHKRKAKLGNGYIATTLYTACSIGKKKVSYKKYSRYVKKLLKVKKLSQDDLPRNEFKMYKNNLKNRARFGIRG